MPDVWKTISQKRNYQKNALSPGARTNFAHFSFICVASLRLFTCSMCGCRSSAKTNLFLFFFLSLSPSLNRFSLRKSIRKMQTTTTTKNKMCATDRYGKKYQFFDLFGNHKTQIQFKNKSLLWVYSINWWWKSDCLFLYFTNFVRLENQFILCFRFPLAKCCIVEEKKDSFVGKNFTITIFHLHHNRIWQFDNW